MLRRKSDKTLPPTSIWPAIRLDSQSLTEHPMYMVKVEVSLCTSRYWELDIPSPRVVGGLGLFDMTPLGLLMKELIPLAMRVAMMMSWDWLFQEILISDQDRHDGQQGGEEFV